MDEPDSRAHGWKEAIVLAHHQRHASGRRQFDQLLRALECLCKRLLDQDVETCFERGSGDGGVARERRRVQDCVGPESVERGLQAAEAPPAGNPHLLLEQRQGLGV